MLTVYNMLAMCRVWVYVFWIFCYCLNLMLIEPRIFPLTESTWFGRSFACHDLMLTESHVFIFWQCVCTWSVWLTRTTRSHADVVLLFSHSTQPVRAVNLGCWLDPMLIVLHVLARSQDVRAWNSLLYYWFDDMLTVLHVFSRSQSVSAWDSLLIWPFLMCFPVNRA